MIMTRDIQKPDRVGSTSYEVKLMFMTRDIQRPDRMGSMLYEASPRRRNSIIKLLPSDLQCTGMTMAVGSLSVTNPCLTISVAIHHNL